MTKDELTALRQETFDLYAEIVSLGEWDANSRFIRQSLKNDLALIQIELERKSKK